MIQPYFYAAPIAPGTLDAYYSKGDKIGAVTKDVAVVVDPTAVRGHHWRLGPNGFGQGVLNWMGGKNFPSGTQRSYAMRFRTAYSGAPDPACGLFSVLGPGIYPRWYTMTLMHNGTNICLGYWGDSGNTGADNTVFAPFNPTQDVAYDLVILQDDSLVFGNLKMYLDGVLIGTLDTNARWTNLQPQNIGMFGIGMCGVFVLNTNIKVEEFAIFDELIDPTEFTGAARTTPIPSTPLDANTWPIESRVRDGEQWNQDGVGKTGTMPFLESEQVLADVFIGEGRFGSYQEPDPSVVLIDTPYGPPGENERVGTFEALGTTTQLDPADVRKGTTFFFDNQRFFGELVVGVQFEDVSGISDGSVDHIDGFIEE